MAANLQAGDGNVEMTREEMAAHRLTYRWFVRCVLRFAIHALVILAVLGWVFSSDMG